MKEDMLVINKYNYKGYVELYKAKEYIEDYEFQYQKKWLKEISLTFVCSVLVLSTFLILGALGLTGPTLVNIAMGGMVASEVIVCYHGLKKMYNFQKEKISVVKEKYPYIDTKIDMYELKECLKEVKILVNDGNIECLKVDEYENYLKIEELKKEYFEETKYDGYVVDSTIEKVELEKPKIKKLVR